jgi:hypothetical protein
VETFIGLISRKITISNYEIKTTSSNNNRNRRVILNRNNGFDKKRAYHWWNGMNLMSNVFDFLL